MAAACADSLSIVEVWLSVVVWQARPGELLSFLNGALYELHYVLPRQTVRSTTPVSVHDIVVITRLGEALHQAEQGYLYVWYFHRMFPFVN